MTYIKSIKSDFCVLNYIKKIVWYFLSFFIIIMFCFCFCFVLFWFFVLFVCLFSFIQICNIYEAKEILVLPIWSMLKGRNKTLDMQNLTNRTCNCYFHFITFFITIIQFFSSRTEFVGIWKLTCTLCFHYISKMLKQGTYTVLWWSKDK